MTNQETQMNLIGKEVTMIDRKIGLVHGIITGYRECDNTLPGKVICGLGFPQVRVLIKEPLAYEGWIPLTHCEVTAQ